MPQESCKVGGLAARLLHDSGFNVLGFDQQTPREEMPFTVKSANLKDQVGLADIFKGVDAVLSCLPYQLNAGIASAAHAAGIHYFDLTEDVPTTKAIIEMSGTAKGLMAPQCGLAPGFVGIVGAKQIAEFDDCRSCRMRVGALPT